MKPIWVIFCGLFRKPRYFEHALMQLLAAKKAGLIEGIVYSTWLGEVDRYDNLRETLERCGVILVETPEPSGPQLAVLGMGNVARQKVSLSWALELIPDDAFVFKTRPDQPIATTPRIADLLRWLNETKFLVTDIDRPAIPYRIWSGRRHPTIPFFIDDRNFFTHVSVARKMCALRAEVYLLMNRSNNIAEINWYAPLFWDEIPFVRRMLSVDWLRLHPAGPEAGYHQALRETGVYWLSQAAYTSILDSYFRLGFDDFSIDDYAFLGVDPLRIFELPASTGHFAQTRSDVESDPRFDAAMSFFRGAEGTDHYGKLLHALPLLDRCVEETSKFGSTKIARRISVPNPDQVSADVSTIDLRNAVRAGERLQDFDASYREGIELEIRLPPRSRRSEFVPIVVTINDRNERPLALDTQRPICLGYRWFSESGPLWSEFPRIPVESYVRPSTEVAFTVLAPPVPGNCTLEVDLLIEGEFWFGRLARASIEIG